MPKVGGSRTTSAIQIDTFGAALAASEPRPAREADRKEKKNYAERLSNRIAVLVANKLRATGQFKGEILPYPTGLGREKPIPSGAFNKPKKTDVNYSTLSGLELLVSIKTLNFRDVKQSPATFGRYTKNMVRNDHELRAEAMDFHERYPFAVLAVLFFIPRDACDDGGDEKSSFAHAIMTFRSRAGRQRPDDPPQMFELFYVGLYDWDGPHRGRVEFFDVMDAPPRRGVPRRLSNIDEVVRRIVGVYGLRNQLYIPWEDEPVTAPSSAAPELSAPPTELDTDEEDDDPSIV